MTDTPTLDLDELDRIDTLKALSDENAEWDKEFFDVLGAAYPALSRELRQARARVEELEHDLETERGAVSYQREARVALESDNTGLQARIAQLESDLAEHKAALAELHEAVGRGPGHETVKETLACAISGVLDLRQSDHESAEENKALTASVGRLESELATLRESAELEVKVAAALGPRFQALQLTRLAMSGVWDARWCSPAWSERKSRKARAATLPDLLRAILETERKDTP